MNRSQGKGPWSAHATPTSGTDTQLIRRTPLLLRQDPRRVTARLFLPGQEPGAPGASRAAGVVARCQAMSDEEVDATIADVERDYLQRHRDLNALLEEHFLAIAHRVPEAADLPPRRRRLIGAFFTREIAIEAAALCNPSVVPHPVQDGPSGSLRFIMSARAVGEGHLSTIVFHSGTVMPHGTQAHVTLDEVSPYVTSALRHGAQTDRERLRRDAATEGADPDSLDVVLETLAADVDETSLDQAIASLEQQSLTRAHIEKTISALRRAVRASYEVSFPAGSLLSERTLFPEIDAESHGVEDARFVRFTQEDGRVTYLATYTGFDGSQVASRRLDTDDFITFRSSSLTGRAAANKGMALFPRPVGGRLMALSRWDRENNAISSSADGFHWDETTQLQTPGQAWEAIQLGNCGPPLETDAGWLVLTHGVGAMRAYSLGALLLDRDNPSTVIGRLREPLLQPQDDERDGYVPNVVYSCGALIHGQTLLLPYGCSDTTIRVAVADLPTLLDRLQGS